MLCFAMICGSAGSQSDLGKAAGAEVAVERSVENLHAAVARSTFGSQNAKKLRGLGPLFEVGMSKKCTPL